MSHPPRRPVRLAMRCSAALVGLTALGATAPANGHPFGDPQQLAITATDAGFDVRWQAAEDDLTSLALRLDVLGGPRAMVFKDGALVPGRTDEADAEKLAASPLLEAYLLSRIELSLGGQECAGALVDASDLRATGAELAYTCSSTRPDGRDGAEDAEKSRPEALTVRARPLTDLHAAYKTMSTGPGGATHVFTTEAETHEFALGQVEGQTVAQSGVEMLGWAGAGAAVLIGAGAVVAGRRKRRTR